MQQIIENYRNFIFIFLFITLFISLLIILEKKKKDDVNVGIKKEEKIQTKPRKEMIEISGDKWIGKRKKQEDAFAILSWSEKEHLSVLADGMGGHSEGQVTSQFAVDRFLDLYTKEKKGIPEIIEKINNELLNFSENVVSKNNVGTTLLVCEITGNRANFFSVGDSSIYIVTKEYIRLLNKHQKKGIYLINYIGYENFIEKGIEKIEVDFDEIVKESKKKDSFFMLMCSDGVDKYLETEIIKDTIVDNIKKSSSEIVDIIIEKLKNRKRIKQDNASIILIKVNNHYLQ